MNGSVDAYHEMTSHSAVTIIVTILLILSMGGCGSDLARRVNKYEKVRDYESAIKLLQRTVNRNPKNAEAQFLLGRIYLRRKSFVKARNAFQASRQESPRFVERIEFLLKKNTRGQFQKGNSFFEQDNYRKAAEHFLHATQLQPSNAEAYRARGHALMQAGKLNAARKAYKSAYKHEGDQKNIETLNNLAALAYRQENYSEAIRYSDEAIGRQNVEPEVIKRLAYAYLQAGNLGKAEKQFEQALRIEPSPSLRRDFAFLLHNREKYDEALPLLRQLDQGKETSEKLLRVLAETLFSLERYQNAVNTYLRLHERQPKNEDVIQNLIIVHNKLGNEGKVKTYRKQLQNMSSRSNE